MRVDLCATHKKRVRLVYESRQVYALMEMWWGIHWGKIVCT